jgi:hypothetical protein
VVPDLAAASANEHVGEVGRHQALEVAFEAVQRRRQASPQAWTSFRMASTGRRSGLPLFAAIVAFGRQVPTTAVRRLRLTVGLERQPCPDRRPFRRGVSAESPNSAIGRTPRRSQRGAGPSPCVEEAGVSQIVSSNVVGLVSSIQFEPPTPRIHAVEPGL